MEENLENRGYPFAQEGAQDSEQSEQPSVVEPCPKQEIEQETEKESAPQSEQAAEPEQTIENPVEENAPTEENAENEESVASVPAIAPEEIALLKGAIDAHFTVVKNLLQFNKGKDANVAKLTNEMQLYRDGVETKLFKSIALNLIGLREDARKSLREFRQRGLSVDEAKKYINYIVYDYEDLLSGLNIVVDGDKILYNNRPTDAPIAKKPIPCEVEEYVLPDAPRLVSDDLSGVIDYLKSAENYVLEVLKKNAQLDKLLNAYIDNAALYEQGIHQVVLYPVVNQIALLYGKIKREVEDALASLCGENTVVSFARCAELLVDQLEKILGECGVSVDPFVSDMYDPQKQRLLKFIPTDDANQNGRIAQKYTDCYLMNDRVIYPQKADVIKYQEKQ